MLNPHEYAKFIASEHECDEPFEIEIIGDYEYICLLDKNWTIGQVKEWGYDLPEGFDNPYAEIAKKYWKYQDRDIESLITASDFLSGFKYLHCNTQENFGLLGRDTLLNKKVTIPKKVLFRNVMAVRKTC